MYHVNQKMYLYTHADNTFNCCIVVNLLYTYRR